MPCNDVTEVLEIRLDNRDCLTGYSLSKGTCGGTVRFLDDVNAWVQGRSADEVLSTPVDDFLGQFRYRSSMREFLHLKHLYALKGGLSALTGRQFDMPNAFCEVESVEHGPEGTRMAARIKIDILTEEIQSCGRCEGCGKDSTSSKSGFAV